MSNPTLTVGNIVKDPYGKTWLVVAVSESGDYAHVRGVIRFGKEGERVAKSTYGQPAGHGEVIGHRPELLAA